MNLFLYAACRRSRTVLAERPLTLSKHSIEEETRQEKSQKYYQRGGIWIVSGENILSDCHSKRSEESYKKNAELT